MDRFLAQVHDIQISQIPLKPHFQLQYRSTSSLFWSFSLAMLPSLGLPSGGHLLASLVFFTPSVLNLYSSPPFGRNGSVDTNSVSACRKFSIIASAEKCPKL